MRTPLVRTLGLGAAVGLILAAALGSSFAERPHAVARISSPGHPETRRSVSPEPLKIADAQIEPVEWSELVGWADDDQARAFATFVASCRPIVRAAPSADARPVRSALPSVCRRALAVGPLGAAAARTFFERNFRPLRIARLGENTGFLTGYYEPVVDGSRVPTGVFTVPIYRRPPDLLAPGAPPGAGFPNKGPAVRLTATGEQVPYYDRGEIEDGALDGRHLEICWVRDPAEALTIQIQGSARVRLEDGTMLRINYDGHNGYPYTPVGRILIERGIIPREEMSMARIREWMRANPEEAREVQRQNRSFVFFRIVGLADDREAVGGQGIPLTAGRSIAVDQAMHAYGTPFFITADLPMAGARSHDPFARTMIAQDTGSAIVGPARADLYFGAGEDAGRVAGRIRHAGQFAILVPREIDPVAAGREMPLPKARPAPPRPKSSPVRAAPGASRVDRGARPRHKRGRP